jgi:hypothetical protein
MDRMTGEGLSPYVNSEIYLLLPIAVVACAPMLLSGLGPIEQGK